MKNLIGYVKQLAAEKMSEDNIPDDDQPDKEFEYIERIVEEMSLEVLASWWDGVSAIPPWPMPFNYQDNGYKRLWLIAAFMENL